MNPPHPPEDPDQIIIPLAKTDPLILSDLHARCFSEGDRWSRDSFTGMLKESLVFGFTIMHREDAAGFILARGVGGETEILTLAVAPDWRRKGVANRLMGALFDHCKGQGFEEIYLEVAADNLAARGLYHKYGFIETGRRARYYANGTDAVLMKCTNLNK